MTPEKDKERANKYPDLYAQRYLSMRQTAMCWGFDCGDGWFDILDRLSDNLTHYGNLISPPGLFRWRRRLASLGDWMWNRFAGPESNWLAVKIAILGGELSQKYSFPFQASQVKEKFGTLRFYTQYTNDVVQALISQASRASAQTCEVCGKYGKLNDEYWLSVRCNSCRAREEAAD